MNSILNITRKLKTSDQSSFNSILQATLGARLETIRAHNAVCRIITDLSGNHLAAYTLFSDNTKTYYST